MIGKIISHYKIIEKLGQGGMGVVYKAEDVKLKRMVALKFLPTELTDDVDSKQRFIQEAQAASSLDHPNICTIYEINETKYKQLFIVMAFYDGETLKEKLARGPLATESVVDIAKQIAAGLAKAHEKGITHRDIKPGNIIITKEGVAKILDFGLAKLAGQTHHTKTGATLGTAAYMSPEQALGSTVDHRTDIWSLGALLYEMLTGQQPFIAEFDQAIIYRIVHHEPPSIGDCRQDLPPELCRITQKAMAKPVDERFQSMREISTYLERIKDKPYSEMHSPVVKNRMRRAKWLLPAAALISLCGWGIVESRIFQHTFTPEPKTIAVISFANLTGDPAYDYLCDAIPNLLISSLEQSPYLRVTTWERLYDLLKQKGRADVSFIDAGLGFDLCRMDGVQAIVMGRINKAGNIFITEANVMDVMDKTLIKSTTVRGNGKESILKTQIDELAYSIAKSMGLSKGSMDKSQTKIVDVTTSSMEAYKFFLRGKMDFERWLFADAQHYLEKAVQIDSNFASAYLYLGIAYSRMANSRQQRAAIEKAKKLSGKVTEKERLMIAAITAPTRDSTAALWQEMIRKYPKEKEAYVGLSSCYRVAGEPLQAIKFLEKATALDPNYGRAWSLMAYPYADLGQHDKALECFKKYSAAFPGDADPYDSIAGLYFHTGQLQPAIANYQEALSIRPDHFSIFKLAYVYAIQEEYSETMKWLDRYIDFKPPGEYIETVYLMRGFYNFWLGKLDNALQDFHFCEHLSDKGGYEYFCDQSYWLSAWAYAAKADFNMARKIFYNWTDRRSKKLPNNQPYYHIIAPLYTGLVDLQQGRNDSANAKGVVIDSLFNNYEKPPRILKYLVTFYRAELLLKKNRPLQAIAMYERPMGITDASKGSGMTVVFVFDENEPFIADALARAWQQHGDLNKAIAEYEKLTDPNASKRNLLLVHPLYHYRLAKLYEQTGEHEKAIARYQKFLQIWQHADKELPEPGEARSRLARLIKRK